MTEVQAAPVPYATVHPTDDRFRTNLMRVSTADIAAWGTRTRSSEIPNQTYLIMAWGEGFDVSETLAQIDALMGFTGP